jgi:predicted nucleic acid-binding protein
MMSSTPNTIISDTSCLIILTNIGELDLLEKVYGEIITTQEVANEFGNPLPSWITIQSPTNLIIQQTLELQLDKGESSAIALALEIPNSTLILDDQKARKAAIKLGLTITGTLGVIIKSKLTGIIPKIQPILMKLQNTDFRLSNDLLAEALKQSDELI